MPESKRRLLPHGADRPLVTLIAMDPAYTGDTGLAVIGLEPSGVRGQPEVWAGPARSAECFRWLGETVARLTPRGTRAHLVTESDGYGPGIARKLGIAVGAVEGLLLDLNAIVPGTREDVSSGTWRRALWGRSGVPKGRDAKKAKAQRHALKRWGIPDLGPDASEALCILEWALRRHHHGDRLS